MNPGLWRLLGGAFLVRLVLSALPGFADDRKTFTSWAQVLATHGPLAIYGPRIDPNVDYTPGYLYALWAVGRIHGAIGGGDGSWHWLLNVVPVASDLALIALVYMVTLRLYGAKAATIVGAILAFTPPLWLDSAIWGQVDALPILFGLLALIAALDRRFVAAWLALTIGLLIKPLIVVIAPIVLLLNIRCIRLRPAVLSLAVAPSVAYLATLPFTTARNPIAVLGFLFDRYVHGASKLHVVSFVAFNAYPIVTDFFQSDSAYFGPLRYTTWALLLVGTSIIVVIAMLARALARTSDDARRMTLVLAAASLSLFALFLFATRMHERYVLPAFVIALPLAWEDRALATALAWLCLSLTVNCLYALNHFMGGTHHPVTVVVGKAFCVGNVLAFALMFGRYAARTRIA